MIFNKIRFYVAGAKFNSIYDYPEKRVYREYLIFVLWAIIFLFIYWYYVVQFVNLYNIIVIFYCSKS